MRIRTFFSLALVVTLFSCSSPVSQQTAFDKTNVSRSVSSNLRDGLLQYLRDNFGKKVITGQMNLAWDQSIDMVERVKTTTGKYPALQGFDFMDYTNPSGNRANADNQTSLAIAWFKNAKNTGKNGIVTFNWHWRDPSRKTNSFYKIGWSGGGVDSSMHIPMKNGEFDPNSGYGPNMVADMDFIASELAQMRDQGVPILWRPLHEGGGSGNADGSGAWFWWGQDGASAYNALYRWMYNYFTNVKGLDNLIWVWNGQGSAFYPGSQYCDVAGWDPYNKGDHSAYSGTYNSLNSIASGKLMALTEVGSMPDPSAIKNSGTWFSYFLTWNDGNSNNKDNNFWSGDLSGIDDTNHYPWNTPSFERSVYSNSLSVTLDSLPSLNPYISTSPSPTPPNISPSPTPASTSIEAESTTITGGPTVQNDASASSGKYVQMNGAGSLVWSFNVAQAGTYNFTVRFSTPFGGKTQNLFVNGVQVSDLVFPAASSWSDLTVPLSLNAGNNSFEIRASWGWQNFDKISVALVAASPSPSPVASPSPSPIPSPTPTPSPSPSPSVSPSPSPVPTPSPSPTPSSGSLVIRINTGNANAQTNNIQPNLLVVNTGTTNVDLTQLKVRYWLTSEGKTLSSSVYWVSNSVSASGSFSAVSPVKTNADTALVLSFASGTLAPGASVQLALGINASDWSNLTQTNDYSFQTSSSFVDAPKVTAYLGSALVWGIEP